MSGAQSGPSLSTTFKTRTSGTAIWNVCVNFWPLKVHYSWVVTTAFRVKVYVCNNSPGSSPQKKVSSVIENKLKIVYLQICGIFSKAISFLPNVQVLGENLLVYILMAPLRGQQSLAQTRLSTMPLTYLLADICRFDWWEIIQRKVSCYMKY